MTNAVNKAINLTLDHLAKEYLSHLPSHVRASSLQEMGRFIRWCGRDRSVTEITPNDIAAYAQWAAPSGGEPLKRLEPVKTFLAHLKKRSHTTDNLGIHLKVLKGSGKRDRFLMKGTAETVPLTQEGYLKLQRELEELKKSRIGIAEELNKAMADKDFRENAPLDAAREYQGHVEARIRELQHVLRNAVIVEEAGLLGHRGGSGARLGSRVVLVDLSDGNSVTYTLVSSNEASLSNGKLSATSPTGKAILEKKEGEEAEVTAPMGIIRYRIEKIEN